MAEWERRRKSRGTPLRARRPLAIAFSVLLISSGPIGGQATGQETPAEIVITSASDDVNGDTSSVEGLQGAPGPDGISLREAIEATNNDPGTYTLSFTSSLKGAIIEVSRLPQLRGGNVFIDGDIDGDGAPDITLQGPSEENPGNEGLSILSSGNTVHAVALRGFFYGVSFSTVSTDGVYRDNVVSNLVMSNIGGAGITFANSAPRNQWINTLIIGNTIRARASGINVALFDDGKRIDGIRIEGNSVRIPGRHKCDGRGGGIGLTAGESGSNNSISGAVIANNSISGEIAIGIRVASGSGDADSNLVENVSVLDNYVRTPIRKSQGCVRHAIDVVTGDSGGSGPTPDDNVTRDVVVRGNRLVGGLGVWTFGGGSGGLGNRFSGLRVVRNSIRVVGWFPGVNVYNGGGMLDDDKPTTDSRFTDVVVDSNKIVVENVKGGKRPPFGGISVIAGDTGGWGPVTGSRIKRVRITNNVVDTVMPGISLVGGNGGPEGTARDNVLTDVVVSNNRILKVPKPVKFVYERGIRGIRVVGGIGGDGRRGARAIGNRVTCVKIRRNRVAGAKDVSVTANLAGARNNKVRLAC